VSLHRDLRSRVLDVTEIALFKGCGFEVSDIPYGEFSEILFNTEDATVGKKKGPVVGVHFSVVDRKYPPAWTGIIVEALKIIAGVRNILFAPLDDNLAKQFSDADVIIVVGRKP
jgi:hypothetical protein